jgi:lysophospholipase L1-like esterase
MCSPFLLWPLRPKKTIQFAVTSSLSGVNVRLRFANIYGKRPYRLGECTIKAGGARAQVTMEGRRELVIPRGGTTYSDTVPLPLTSGSLVEISLYYLNRPAEGNAVEAAPFIPSLDAIEVESTIAPEVIVAFGDSITQQGKWTQPLAAKLLATYVDKVVLINKGISGNRVLHAGTGRRKVFGAAAVDRLERDALAVSGVKTVIIALGTNDIGMSSRRGHNSLTANQLTGALQAMAERLQGGGIRVIGSTLLPCMGWPGYQPYHEAIRNEVNAWIRTGDGFDRVVDFDAALRAEDDPSRMKTAYDSGDHLHPSSAGGEAMAEAAFNTYTARTG